MEKPYRYLGYFLLLLIPLTLAAFYKTYIEQFPDFEEEIGVFIHVHAFIASVWILMLIVQPFLIYKKNYPIHRTIGKLSYIIFPLLILSFIPQIINTVNHGNSKNLFFPLADSTLLMIFYTLAIYHKGTSAKHMRYMIALSLVFLGPTIGRIGPILIGWTELLTQNVQYAIIYGILISLVIYDKTHQKGYTPYLVAIFLYVLHQIVYHFVFL